MPWAWGVGIGILSWFAFATVDRGLGITTAFEYTAALADRAVDPAEQAENPVLRRTQPEDRLGMDAGARGAARQLLQLEAVG